MSKRKERKKEDAIHSSLWRPFCMMDYRRVWRTKKLKGVLRYFAHDIKMIFQRVNRGYCDADCWEMYTWFLDVVPAMLKQLKDTRWGSPANLGVNYENEDGILVNDKCHEEWDTILDKMIFLFHECDERRSTTTNPYEEDHNKIYEEFSERYGWWGEKLQTEEEKNNKKHHTMHFPDEIPEYKDICDKWRASEKELDEYRLKQKDRAFALFAEHFFSLWD